MISVELTEKEQKILELIRSTEDSEVIITIERNEPCRVEVLQRNIPLE